MQHNPPLRKYQIAAKTQVYQTFKQGKNRVLLYLPTGGGKTSVAADIVADFARQFKEVLLVAHRKELIEQLHARLHVYQVRAGVIMAKHHYKGDSVNVASIQTLNNREFPKARLVIIDEGHHAVLENNQKKPSVFKRFFDNYNNEDTYIIGLSATPRRLDNKPLGNVYQHLVVPVVDGEEVDVQYLTNEGWLVPAKYFGAPIKEDYDPRQGHEKELFISFNKKVLYQGVVDNYLKYTPNKKMVCFCINVEHSIQTQQEFQQNNIESWHLDGSTPADERACILREFKESEGGVLCNVGILTEGYDLPNIYGIIGFRPTDSESLWLQMIGRALRPIWPASFDPNNATAEERKSVIANSPKPYAIILDHGENFARLGSAIERREYSLTKPKDKRAGVPSVSICGPCGRYWRTSEEGPVCPECGAVPTQNANERKGPQHKNSEFVELVPQLPEHLNKGLRQMSITELEEYRQYKKLSLGWVVHQLEYRAINLARAKPEYPPYEIEAKLFEFKYITAVFKKFAALELGAKKKYSDGWVYLQTEKIKEKYT